jgi:hypothetical protein
VSALTGKLTGSARHPSMPCGDFIAGEAWVIPAAQGYVLDGAWYALDGQPPVAVSTGWGDLSWLVHRR